MSCACHVTLKHLILVFYLLSEAADESLEVVNIINGQWCDNKPRLQYADCHV